MRAPRQQLAVRWQFCIVQLFSTLPGGRGDCPARWWDPATPKTGFPLCACIQAALQATLSPGAWLEPPWRTVWLGVWCTSIHLQLPTLRIVLVASRLACSCCSLCVCLWRPANQGALASTGDLPFPGLHAQHGVLDCVHSLRGVMFSLPAPTAGCWYSDLWALQEGAVCVLLAECAKPQLVGSCAGSPKCNLTLPY